MAVEGGVGADDGELTAGGRGGDSDDACIAQCCVDCGGILCDGFAWSNGRSGNGSWCARRCLTGDGQIRSGIDGAAGTKSVIGGGGSQILLDGACGCDIGSCNRDLACGC